jgi:hypothetical protein
MKKNVEVVSLVYRSVDYLHFIVNQLKSDRCKVDGWDVGVRVLANNASQEVIDELPKLGINYTIFNGNYNSNEYYINKVYRGYNQCVITSEYDNVCLVNSDDVFSKDWLKNLLKHHDGVNIPCSRLIESGKMPSGTHGVNLGSLNFGRTPQTFNLAAFDEWVEQNSEDKILPQGLYMPCVFEKKRFIEAGMYPCGNVYHNGIGTYNHGGHLLWAGDDFFFHKILEEKFGMKHITVFDSPVYHIQEGEKDS